MYLKKKHIIILISILVYACAMESGMSKSGIDTVSYNNEKAIDSDTKFNMLLINQKLNDFYDLIILQNQYPEFTDEVSEQLKNYTNDSVKNFKTDNIVTITDLKQLGSVIIVNDSVQKVRLTYKKAKEDLSTTTDTIYAIVTKKNIVIDNKRLISKKIRFSKD